MVLQVAFEDSVPADLRDGWERSLAERVETIGIEPSAPGTPGAGVLRVTVALDEEEGRTGSGAPYRVARARAAVGLERISLPVESAPAVDADRAAAASRALRDLLGRVARTAGP